MSWMSSVMRYALQSKHVSTLQPNQTNPNLGQARKDTQRRQGNLTKLRRLAAPQRFSISLQ